MGILSQKLQRMVWPQGVLTRRNHPFAPYSAREPRYLSVWNQKG